MPWISIVGAVAGQVIGGAMGDKSAGKAADAQTQASEAAIAEQRRQFDLTRGDFAPYQATGQAANARLASLLGIGPKTASGTSGMPVVSGDLAAQNQFLNTTAGYREIYALLAPQFTKNGKVDTVALQNEINSRSAGKGFTDLIKAAPAVSQTAPGGQEFDLLRRFTTADLNADPVYNAGREFGLKTGTDAINARAIGRGGYDSGATLKELTRYGTDYGMQRAGDAYNRFSNDQSNIYNRLAGISGTGQTSSGQVAQYGANMANNVSNLQTGIGNAQAAGIVGGANAWGSAAGGVNNAYNNYQNRQMFDRLMGGGGGGGGSNYGQLYGASYGAGGDTLYG